REFRRRISRRCLRSSRASIHEAWARAICASVCSFSCSVKGKKAASNTKLSRSTWKIWASGAFRKLRDEWASAWRKYKSAPTISNIAHQIVSRQRDFFEDGPSNLKPMTMGDIADTIGVHETTVSRAVSGKYMATPQGIFEMKYFFTPGYQTATGESMSNTSVKEAILDLVKHEPGSSPLSDHEIVEILSERGIPIARRTVAKYRTELNILPSHMRRKY